MADNKMLIDATHPEETRVVVLRGGRVEEFDYESAGRKLLRGNIYLAKVTRVEPALQAAFVDYGGNRHGFLAFNEIHPDYYQIPMADRIALIEEEAAAAVIDEDDAHQDDNGDADADSGETADGRVASAPIDDDEPHADNDDEAANGLKQTEGDVPTTASAPAGEGEDAQSAASSADQDGENDSVSDSESDGEVPTQATTDDAANDAAKTITEAVKADDILSEAVPTEPDQDDNADTTSDPTASTDDTHAENQPAATPDDGFENGAPIDIGLVEDEGVQDVGEEINGDEGDDSNNLEASDDAPDDTSEADPVEETGTQDAMEEVPYRPRRSRRSYKIQEVIKRRQILLIQVVKEERGNKGAALTTYLSLAGRYTVLMPNTARGGGVSRKISSPQDRKRMKAIASDLEVPEGMGLIIRTAGASRTKQEIRRDFEYLLRLWESVREVTLESTAPSLVYEEGNLIKRSIRDLYNKDVDEIVVAGEEAYRQAKSFMRMLMPSHTRNVTLYKAPEPVFTRFQIERQLNAMFSPQVPLKSGGYLVINQTEALVAVDVNSGRSTREFSIEETALHTNLEAADEVARQLKLRDLAGLIVIDFIDMDEKRNNRAVERRMKEALRDDRARIQVGRISHFGLMEMSRQRMRTGVLEGSTSPCQQCQGTGIIRSTESVALAVLRGLEDAVTAGSRARLIASTTPDVALYILNSKRAFIDNMEARLGQPISVQISDKMVGANFKIEKGPALPRSSNDRNARNVVNIDSAFESESGDRQPGETSSSGPIDRAPRSDDDQPRRRRRRRRGARSGDDARDSRQAQSNDVDLSAGPDDTRPIDVNDSEPGSLSGNGNGIDSSPADSDEERPRRSRRRGRRGGRRNRERREAKAGAMENATQNGQSNDPADDQSAHQDQSVEDSADTSVSDNNNPATGSENPDAATSQGDGFGLGPQPDMDATSNNSETTAEPDTQNETTAKKPVQTPRTRRSSTRTRRSKPSQKEQQASDPDADADTDTTTLNNSKKGDTSDGSPSNGTQAQASSSSSGEPQSKKPTRTGWWQRRLLGDD